MARVSRKPMSPNFKSASNAPSFDEQMDHKLEFRNNSFYGAVFNALDDYFRKGHAYALSPSDFCSEYKVNGDEFIFTIRPTWQNDSNSEDPNEAIRTFFNEIYDIVAFEELEDIKALGFNNPKTGLPAAYTMTVTNKFELMQVLEKLLKPFDFDESYLPTLRHSDITEESPLRFEMFAQYSLKHIRTMFYNIQGRGFEGHGLHLKH